MKILSATHLKGNTSSINRSLAVEATHQLVEVHDKEVCTEEQAHLGWVVVWAVGLAAQGWARDSEWWWELGIGKD
jgi:hypothetical protein